MTHIIYLSIIAYLLVGFVIVLKSIDLIDFEGEGLSVKEIFLSIILAVIWPLALALALFVVAYLQASDPYKSQHQPKPKKK